MGVINDWMDDLISRDKLIINMNDAKAILHMFQFPKEQIDVAEIVADAMIYNVRKAPTVDAVPVIHGHWIRYDIDYDDECSNCHAHTDRALMCCYGSPSTRYEQHHFCPWCGAKMTGDFIYDLETGEQIKDGEQDD